MTRSTTLLLLTALLSCTGARAQSTPPPPAEQPAKPNSTLDDDPQFKRLSPEQQKLVRQMMESLDKAVADEKKSGATPKAAPANPAPLPNAPPAPAGCIASPVKKPKFHIPKTVQDAINKGAKNIGSKTGVALDPNTPAQTVNDAQKDIGKPCPPAKAPASK
jgi:hypothetical protein